MDNDKPDEASNTEQGKNAPEQGTSQTKNQQGNPPPESIPYSRFQEVNEAKKRMEAESAALRKRLDELEAANLTEEERRQKELDELRSKATESSALQKQLDAQKAEMERLAKTWLAGRSDEGQKAVVALAAALGRPGDVGAFEIGTSLLANREAILAFLGGQTTLPAVPPTDMGQPGKNANNSEPLTMADARKAFLSRK